MPLWSGRFDEAPDAELLAFGASFGFDRRLLPDDIAGSIAWAGALGRAGVLSSDDAGTLQRALTALLENVSAHPELLAGDHEDVHSFVEHELIARIGDLGRRLHTGRSRNEQVSLDFRLYLRRRIPVLQREIRGLIEALLDRARRADASLMPSYTHMRRAQPVLVAHFFLAHVSAFQRDHERLAQARDEADAMPLGSGAIAGTNYAIDTTALARELGFSRVVANSLDATSDRDFVSTFLHTCALVAVHLSRLSEDLILFAGEEFGFFELADAVSTGSSLMPQKKNPDPLELARGKAGRVIGRLVGWLATMKGLPSGYNKDLQEDKEAVFDAEDTVLPTVRACARVVATLGLNQPRAAAAAEGLLLATEAADYLVEKGVPFRRAHEVVGGIVRTLVASGRDFPSLTMDEWRGFDDRFGGDIRERLTGARSVASKKTPQSTAPEAVAAALRQADEWLATRRT
ncbi:MAG TPA: argininosuccinate lyase [Vicinamibacterales bacterium]|nr:argininosuccinate lyase [Vicinamibacterales bacterium]